MVRKTSQNPLGIEGNPFESACPGYPTSGDDFLRELYKENGLDFDSRQECTGTLIHEEEMRKKHFQRIAEGTRKIAEENFKLYSPVMDYVFEHGPVTIRQIKKTIGTGGYIDTGIALMLRAGYLKKDEDGRFSTSKSMVNEFYKNFGKPSKF